jgi:hypothetical protein
MAPEPKFKIGAYVKYTRTHGVQHRVRVSGTRLPTVMVTITETGFIQCIPPFEGNSVTYKVREVVGIPVNIRS